MDGNIKGLLHNIHRFIYKELEFNPRLEEMSVVNFKFLNNNYKFKMKTIKHEYVDWCIELWKVGDEDEIKLDSLLCNAGHKKCLVLFAELMIRRHLHLGGE